MASQIDPPSVTVVIPNLNYGQYLDLAISSVNNNKTKSKILVIDGLSNDETLQYLSNCSNPNLRWFSKKDTGPAQAINFGFQNVETDIIGWLNSDDCYAPNAIDRAMRAFRQNPKLIMVYGNAKHINAVGKVTSSYPTKSPESGAKEFMRGCFICQPTVFFRKSALAKIGYLDEKLATAFDFDFWIRFFKRYKLNQIEQIQHTQAYSRLHSQCITQRAREKVIIESMQVICKYFKNSPIHWAQSYIEEYFNKYPFIDNDETLITSIKKFLIKVQSLISPSEYKQLVSYLEKDQRLILSNSQVQLSVLPDGWVSHKLIVKMRFQPGQLKTIELKCSVCWPKLLADQRVILTVRSSEGQSEKVCLNGGDDFLLKLEAPDTDQAAFFSWQVTTRQSFIPVNFLKGSHDTRKLSFKVNSLQML